MKVALLKSPIGGILGLEMLTFAEPLGLECVAGAVEAGGHDCAIFDLRIDGEEAGLAACHKFAPDVVGLECNFTTERYRTIRLARAVADLLPSAFVVLGGHDATRDWQWFEDPAVDAIAAGDGEETLPLLLDALRDGRDLTAVPGLAIRIDGERVRTAPPPERRDLDSLPPPARHLVRAYAPQYYINYRRPMALLETARGCPFRCNFCSVWKFHETTLRTKSPERVVQELAGIEAPNVFITDDIFWLDVRRGREMARQIKRAGISKYFTVQTRTDIVCRSPDLIEEWKDCGHLAIFLGLEAVTDGGLDAVNKRSTASTNRRAIEILKDLGVGFTPNFIVDPAWDHDDFARLRSWIEELGAYNSGFSVLTPLPGTDLWDTMRDRITTANWELFDIVHTVLPTRLPLAEFYREYASLWRAALDLRLRQRGRMRTYLQMAAAVTTGKVTVGALRKGMNIAKVFSDPHTFLRGHDEPS